MKKSLFILAALSALIFTACNKGKTDDVTTDAVRVEVTGQISGALTKCLSVRYEIKDFGGKIHSGMLNNEFKGTNLELNEKFICGNVGKSLDVRFFATRKDGKVDEVGPWACKFNVKACRDADGRYEEHYGTDDSESQPLPIDDFPSFLSLITNSINSFFGDTWICRVTVRKQGFDLETVKP